MTPRSWLFVPGDSQRKLDKSASCGSDALIIDLEDSVAETAKDAARELTSEFVRRTQAHPSALWVRVNPLSSRLTRQDIRAVVGLNLAGIVLPKCEGSSDIVAVANLLAAAEAHVGAKRGSIKILPLVTETPKALFHMQTYALATARLAGLSWGAEDLSAAVGAISARDEAGQLTAPYQLARSLCLFAASAAGIVAVETVYPAFSDDQGLTAFAAAARRDGFAGMMAIHPGQVPIINAAFTPTDEELALAKEIIAEFEAAPERGTVALRGKMIDRPHLTQAKKLLERSASAASRAS